MRKFSMAALRLIAQGIRRLVENKEENVPKSSRICHDYDKAIDGMHMVYLANGDIVAQLIDRNGVRYSKDGTGKHGGARTKGNSEDGQWLDHRALSAMMEK